MMQKLQYQLQQIPLDLFLGVPEAERRQRQRIWVNISFEAENKISFQEDSLADAPDYHEIYLVVKHFEKKKTSWKTLEALHAQIVRDIENLGLPVKHLTLEIIKKPYSHAMVHIQTAS